MKKEKWSILLIGFIIIILVICIGIAIYYFKDKINEEINATEDFIELLQDNSMIEETDSLTDTDFQVLSEGDGEKEYYRVTSKDFGIDLDEDLKVIGFNYNYNITSYNGVAITEEEARVKAENYVSILVDEDYKFKSEIESLEESTPYYGYIFTRYKDGYPFYSDQIMIQINKLSGYITGYSNTASQGKPKKVEINVKSQGAEAIAIESFNKLNKEGKVNTNETYTAYCDNKEKTRTELCYVVTVSGSDIDNNETRIKYFVSSDTGEIINFIKDNVTKTFAE